MKRYTALFIVVVAASLLAIYPVHAQGGQDVITLNDATPGIDVVITPVEGTSGAVALELYQASVTVVDSAGNVVFQMADGRVHELELRLAPGTGSYTLTAERLPGVSEAYVRAMPLSDLTQQGATMLVANTQQPLAMQQAVDLPLTSSTPSQVTAVSIPADATGTVSVSFPGAPVTAQVVDDAGRVVATLYGGGFDGMSMVMDGGQYELTLLNTDPQQATVANAQVMPALPSDLDDVIPAMVAQSGGDQTTTVSASSCYLTVNTSSVNLRSGPGTGYSVLDYGFRNEEYQVGGTNSDGSWLVIGTGEGTSAWIVRSAAALSGTCQNLAVYNIPYREAPTPQVIVQQQPSASVSSGSGGYYGDDDDDEYEHEEYEHDDDDHGEHDDDDHDEHDDDD